MMTISLSYSWYGFIIWNSYESKKIHVEHFMENNGKFFGFWKGLAW